MLATYLPAFFVSGAAFDLAVAMAGLCAPGFHRLLVAPERQ